MSRLLLRLAAATALIVLPTANPGLIVTASAHEQHAHADHEKPAIVGDLEITGAWARAMLPNQPAGGGYATITNTGEEADRLVGVSSPTARQVEIHVMKVVDDVMTMRPLEGGLEIPPGETVELAPGGLHLMFMEVTDFFEKGDAVPVTLTFEKAGDIEVLLPVRSAQGAGDHSH